MVDYFKDNLGELVKDITTEWSNSAEFLQRCKREYQALSELLKGAEFLKLIADQTIAFEVREQELEIIKSQFINPKGQATNHVKDLMRQKGYIVKVKLAQEVANRLYSEAVKDSRTSGTLGIRDKQLEEVNQTIQKTLNSQGITFMLFRWEPYELKPEYWLRRIQEEEAKLVKLGSKESYLRKGLKRHERAKAKDSAYDIAQDLLTSKP